MLGPDTAQIVGIAARSVRHVHARAATSRGSSRWCKAASSSGGSASSDIPSKSSALDFRFTCLSCVACSRCGPSPRQCCGCGVACSGINPSPVDAASAGTGPSLISMLVNGIGHKLLWPPQTVSRRSRRDVGTHRHPPLRKCTRTSARLRGPGSTPVSLAYTRDGGSRVLGPWTCQSAIDRLRPSYGSPVHRSSRREAALKWPPQTRDMWRRGSMNLKEDPGRGKFKPCNTGFLPGKWRWSSDTGSGSPFQLEDYRCTWRITSWPVRAPSP
eukprot:scaffold1085_cov407-Prasinococcus_capsulatus_cf.AAC.46